MMRARWSWLRVVIHRWWRAIVRDDPTCWWSGQFRESHMRLLHDGALTVAWSEWRCAHCAAPQGGA